MSRTPPWLERMTTAVLEWSSKVSGVPVNVLARQLVDPDLADALDYAGREQ